MIRNLPANTGDAALIPGSKRSPGVGNGNPLQHSCLENSNAQRNLAVAEEVVVHGVAKLDMTKHACTWLPSTLPRSSGVRKCLQLHLIPLFIHLINATVWLFHASPHARNKTDKLPAATQLYPLQQTKT